VTDVTSGSGPAAPGPWWRTAVFYEVYLRSFADSDGDGVGDLPGLRSRLPYLADLGVDALWITPFYPSPLADAGYDVADYRDVDPSYGGLAAFDDVLADAHALGLRVTIDIVPNHTSDQHPWFRAALTAAPGSPERDRYLFRDGRGPDGGRPPNNWESVFGGPAWTRVPAGPDGSPGQWYLHLFTAEQPDLNWRNPEVGDDFASTLRFWLDRGVDGFRIDVAHGLIKDAALPDNPGVRHPGPDHDGTETLHAWDQPEVHAIFRRWRAVLDSYPGDRMAVGEAWVLTAERLAAYVRPDELQQAFNFLFLSAPWSAPAMRTVIDDSLAATALVGATTTWVLSNHDVVRHVTRYGDGTTGQRRARAALLLLLALPGSAYLYQGEELGLPQVEVAPEARQDPVWERTGHTQIGRDGCRVPIPWSGDAPPYGFSSSADTWLPTPPGWAECTVSAESTRLDSMLALYRSALKVRRGFAGRTGSELRWKVSAGDRLDFEVGTGDHRIRCVVNMGPTPVAPPPGTVVLASQPLVGDQLGRDTAVWLRPD
jgi:alpha-glucosidase